MPLFAVSLASSGNRSYSNLVTGEEFNINSSQCTLLNLLTILDVDDRFPAEPEESESEDEEILAGLNLNSRKCAAPKALQLL